MYVETYRSICRRNRFFENASKSKSLDNENAKYAKSKKSRLYVKARIEIATLGEDTDPDTDIHGEGRM